MMEHFSMGKFSMQMRLRMLCFLTMLYVMNGVQGKAFPNGDYEAIYHYIPVEEGIVQLPARYSPENLPNYNDFVPGYVQVNDWSAYYHQPMVPQPILNPYSNIEHHKMKAEHTWHFIDHNNVPAAKYMDGRHFESIVESPNVNEVLVKKEAADRHNTEYDGPIVTEALKKGNMDNEKAEIPVIIDSLTIKEKPIKEKPIKEKPIKEKPIKEKPIKEKPIYSTIKIDQPIVVDYQEEGKSIQFEPAASYKYDSVEKPIKEKPKDGTVFYGISHYPNEFDSFYKVKESENKKPLVVEALVGEEEPTFHREDESEVPVVVEALVREEEPTFHKEDESEVPVVVEALVRKEEPTFHREDESEVPVVVEALVRKTPVVEVLPFEQDADSNEASKGKGIFDGVQKLNEPNMDNLNEDGELGSAMDVDRSRLARSFLPVNSNVFPMVPNIKEQEKLKFKSCFTPKNETGNCMPIQLCSVSSTISNIDEVLRNVCIIDEVFIGVCCPEFPVETVRVDWEQLKPNKEMLNEEKSQILKECGILSTITDQDPWPWMASLIAKSSDKIFCGGALINEHYVLTAAHCTKRIPRNQILVRLGRPASNQPEPDFEVIEIKRHAGYNPRTMQNDIALLKLSRRVQLGDFRRVVCLAKENTESFVNESASLLRWKETPGEIKDVEPLLVISFQECQSKMKTAMSDSILCTEPRTDETMCNADSGAPLIIAKDDKFEVIGILTWNRNDCDERFPTVFTRVSSYHRWIEKLAS